MKQETKPPTRRPSVCRLFLAFGVLAMTSGCSSRGNLRSPFDGSGGTSAAEPIRVEIQSLNFNDVTVWAVRQGTRIRLGTVTGKTDQVFRIDWNLAVPISFVVDVIGGRSCTTPRIDVDRNARIWISVPANVGTQACRVGRR